jgi:hypothetical protein
VHCSGSCSGSRFVPPGASGRYNSSSIIDPSTGHSLAPRRRRVPCATLLFLEGTFLRAQR